MIQRFRLIATAMVLWLIFCGGSDAARSYWQQDVAYKMDVRLAEDGRTLLGDLEFHYRNNSLDTLKELRFHSPYNSFQPGSPAHLRWRRRGSRRIENASPADYGRTTVSEVQDDRGIKLAPEFDYSIFRLPLSRPLAPGDSLRLTMKFESYIPGSSVAYRSSFSHGQLKVAHWYPQVCVYDPTEGWVDNQYLGTGEAYGEFGVYQVSLTLPETFIVGATGTLINRSEVLPEDLLRVLDLSNYLTDTPASDTTFGDPARTKTWRFSAENVHDFAWVADPRFRLDHTRSGDTDIWILVRQEHAYGWRDAAEVTRQGMDILQREIGSFPYPEFTVVDCYSGMEYPGIVFCGGRTPRYKLLFWHEMAHNYFMGALGSNQTERPFLDEGFTTYWEIRIMEELLGENNITVAQTKSGIIRDKDRWYRGLRPYIQRQKSGYILPLHIESDLPEVYMQYRVSAYYKPASMLIALQAFVGEEGIRNIMHDYYDRWKFKHPYEEDFFRSAEETLGTSLEWFYDAWVRGSKTLDYALEKTSAKVPGKIGLRVEREGDMILPVKVSVNNDKGGRTVYYIPLGDEPTPPDCDIRLPRWDQRRYPRDEFTFEVDGEDYDGARLHPDGLIADVNPLNDTASLLPPLQVEWDYPYPHVSPVDSYRVRWAPSVFYNGVDGLQFGAYVKGDYLERWSKLQLALRVGSLTGRVSGEMKFEDDFIPLGRGSFWGFSGFVHEGYRGGSWYFRHEQRKGFEEPASWSARVGWSLDELYDGTYPREPVSWEEGILSSLHFDAAVFPRLNPFRFSASLALESGAPGGDFQYARASSEVISMLSLGDWDFSLRGFLGGTSDGAPVQTRFGLGGGGPLAQSHNRWLRSRGTLPDDWHLRVAGDGDLYGYASPEYLARNIWSVGFKMRWNWNFVRRAVTGRALPPRFRPKITPFFFAGSGDARAWFSQFKFAQRHDEAGFGFKVGFPSNSGFEIAFPLYISDPLTGESKWESRWVLSFEIKK
jgi:aminopeptidase N